MIEKLRQVPRPENASYTQPDGSVVQIDWPPNLKVLEAFETCWNETYARAYGAVECHSADDGPDG